MKRMTIKTILTLAALALLLTFTVSGTLAYIATNTEAVQNVFEPVEVQTSITESFNREVKSSVVVNNTGDIPVFIRVAVIGNWCNDAGEIVEPWNESFTLGDGWSKRDEYYYYDSAVEAGSATNDLLGSDIVATANNGLHLEVTVMQQAIQAEPTSAVEGVWGFVPGGSN